VRGKDGYATFGTLPSANSFISTSQGFIDWVQAQPPAPLRAAALQDQELPVEQLSTQRFTDASGCDHAARVDCPAPFV